MTDQNNPDDQEDDNEVWREIYAKDPPWLADADPTSIVEYYKLTLTRQKLIGRIGDTVGFEDDDRDRDRLNKAELAKILVYIETLVGDL